MANYIAHADLTVQHVDDIARAIRLDAKDNTPDFSEIFEHTAWPKKGNAYVDSIKFRVLIHQPIDLNKIEDFTLLENTAPTSRGLVYATFQQNVRNYATKYVYTWQDVEGNADKVVADCREELGGWTTEMRTAIYGHAVLETKSILKTVTASDKGKNALLNMFRRANLLMSQQKLKPFYADGRWMCMMPSLVADAFTEEFTAANKGLPLPEKTANESIDGYIGHYKKFDIKTPTGCGEDILVKTGDDGKTVVGYYVVFVGKTQTSRLPGDAYSETDGDGGIEIYLNELGTGILKDKNGEYTADDNKQKGSVAENMKYVAAHIRDDRAVVKCFIEAGYLNDLDFSGDDIAETAAEMIEEKDSKAGAYEETQREGEKEINYSPFVLKGADTVVKSSSINLKSSSKLVEAKSSDTGKATAELQTDKVTIKVTGVAAGEATITAVAANGNEQEMTITVTNE